MQAQGCADAQERPERALSDHIWLRALRLKEDVKEKKELSTVRAGVNKKHEAAHPGSSKTLQKG